MVPKKYKTCAISLISKRLPTAKIYLFGSRAKTRHPERSDIDIAVDTGHEVSGRIMGDLRDDFCASNIPFFVDVVDVHSLSNEMKNEIMSYAVPWKK